MKRVVIVSDTHVPSRTSAVPEWVRREVRAADHVIHAGDFDTPEAYEEFRDLAGEFTAVAGNNDPDSLGLSPVEVVRIEGVEFFVAHHRTTGRARRPDGRGDEEADVRVFGHTHQTLDTVSDGVRVVNPGSCTAAWPSYRETVMVATVDGGEVDVETLSEPFEG